MTATRVRARFRFKLGPAMFATALVALFLAPVAALSRSPSSESALMVISGILLTPFSLVAARLVWSNTPHHSEHLMLDVFLIFATIELTIVALIMFLYYFLI
jgi:hypothetical protein